MQLVKSTSVDCICHGVSGSCSVQTCFKRVPDIEQLAIELVKKYDAAKFVKVENHKLKPVSNKTLAVKKDELVYCTLSPKFCKRDLENGIPGTFGRRCYPNKDDYTSCTKLCCDGAVEKVVQKMENSNYACCKFVWCCYLDCSECGTYNETQYFCK